MIPKDPMMLLSYINMKLRDEYSDLRALCDGLGVDRAELIKQLETIDYHYDEEQNRFY